MENADHIDSLRVAVIGAGAAGLVSARELRREGHEAVVFEQDASIGGIWNYSEAVEEDLLGLDPHRERIHSSLYASVRTNLPREIMSFSDFPFVPEAMKGRSVDSRRFCKHEEVLAYLEVFAEEYDLLPLIRFSQRVIRVRLKAEQNGKRSRLPKWSVTSVSRLKGHAQDALTEDFDAVVCCVGTYHAPNLPDLKGLQSFPGRQMHCHNYRRNSSFRGKSVLVVGASFSGDEIARCIAEVAKAVYHTARTWATAEVMHPRANMRRVAWIRELTQDSRAVFSDGEDVHVDCVVYCTGYQYSFPFLEESKLVSTDEGHVHPVYKHIFVPSAPSLAFVGLLWKSLRFPQFELQAKIVARVLAGRLRLPSAAIMEAEIQAFYRKLEHFGLPIRYTHNQGDVLPPELSQWTYSDELTEWAGHGLAKAPQWRRSLHSTLQSSIFGRPETFRDLWTPEETAAFAGAAEECHQLWLQHLAAQVSGRRV